MLDAIRNSLRRPQIAIRGSHPFWLKALGPGAPIWRRIGDFSVVHVTRLGLLPTWRKRYAIPMFEHHVGTIPRPCWALVPSSEAVDVLKDKARFARYAVEHGLEEHLPRRFELTAPLFPAVLKRTDLNAGDGLVVVETGDALARHLFSAPWAGHEVLLQELIEDDTEYAAHVVCVAGRIVWSLGYAYALDSAREIRRQSYERPIRPFVLDRQEVEVFERFLAPLRYDGPANIDYKRRSDGRLAIFEINARFGGSLMRPDRIDDLEAALRVVLDNATWHPAGGQ